MKRFSKLLIWLNIFLALATLLAYVSPHLDPSELWPLSFFGIGYFYLLVANVVFMLFWMLRKKHHWWISLMVIFLGCFHLNTYIGTSLFSQNHSNEHLKLTSYNIGGLQLHKVKDKTKRKNKVRRIVNFFNQRAKPDILCVQEFGWVRFFSEELDFQNIAHNKGVAIYTSLPIVDKGSINFSKSSNAAVWADIDIDGKIVRVYNVHLQSNAVSSQAESLIDTPDPRKKRTWINAKSVIKKVKWATARRVAQARMVANHMILSPYPVILCGDFNDTPQSYTYNVLSQGLRNTFREKGLGLGITYAGSIPGLHIDHILVDENFVIQSHNIANVNLSDHYPVSTEISFSE